MQELYTSLWEDKNDTNYETKPKYGYARDRYGRIQERDSFKDGVYSVED